MTYEQVFKKYLKTVETRLEALLPGEKQYPSRLHEAMRYAVFSGGKRFRCMLAMAACEACGRPAEEAVLPAAAIELIHSSSLVHDDLPALDNDEFRRGKLTVHRRYGETLAILVGDALLTLAFHVLAKVRPAQRGLDLLREISTAAGTYGMIGGQVADLMTDKREMDLPMIEYINVHKTGQLIKASAASGAIAAGADSRTYGRILKYGESVGLAFQTIDDLEDGDGYVRILKSREVRQKARDLIAKAKRQVRPLGKKAGNLVRLADFLLNRMPKEMPKHVAVDSKH